MTGFRLLERDLKSALLLAAPRELPTLRLFNRMIVRVTLKDPDRTYAIGIKGQCDLWGVTRGGLHVELETKKLKGKKGEKQLVWQAFCRNWGIPHLFLEPRKGETVDETVKRWCGEIYWLLNDRALPVVQA